MSASTPPPFEAGTWKDLYAAALMETDQNRILSRIATAEHAIVERARQLLKVSGDHIEEEQAMDDALYALHAWKSCLALHGRLAEAA